MAVPTLFPGGIATKPVFSNGKRPQDLWARDVSLQQQYQQQQYQQQQQQQQQQEERLRHMDGEMRGWGRVATSADAGMRMGECVGKSGQVEMIGCAGGQGSIIRTSGTIVGTTSQMQGFMGSIVDVGSLGGGGIRGHTNINSIDLKPDVF
ncbi:hypothetical protein HK104_007264, partial [Borealophlyctis nickersoniae]